MNKLEQAARQALEALEYHVEQTRPIQRTAEAITALREALEAGPQPAAIPAEWLEEAFRDGWAMCRDSEIVGEEEEDWAFANSTTNSRMIDAQQAAPQPARQPLTEDQVWESNEIMAVNANLGLLTSDLMMLVRAIERTQELQGEA